jgi:hypothetical protein
VHDALLRAELAEVPGVPRMLEHHEGNQMNHPTKTTITQNVSASTSARVGSGSDERIVNNVMRHEYRVLTDTEKNQMQAVKDKGLEFWQLVATLGTSRELSLAQTRIEEAVMWAVKHITK